MLTSGNPRAATNFASFLREFIRGDGLIQENAMAFIQGTP
jgi:hypothetical protein